MGAGQSKAKDGKDGKDGISVKDWGLWSESDKTEFITAIRNNEAFRDDVKNKLSSDVDFRNTIVNLMKEDSSFKSSFINSLAADVPFRNSVALAVNNASFKTDITGQLVATILKDPGFIAAARGPKGDSIVGPKGDSIVGPKGDSIVGPPGPIGLTPEINEQSIRTPVSQLLTKEGLWCSNGKCILPTNQQLRLNEGVLSLSPNTVLSADLPNNGGGRFNLTANDLTVGVNARFPNGIQVGDTTTGALDLPPNNWNKGLNIKNTDGSWTHFNANGGSDNDIKGHTAIRGNTKIEGIWNSGQPAVFTVNGRNITAELDRLRGDVDHIAARYMRKDKRYNIRADRAGLFDNKRFLSRANDNTPVWSTDSKGEWQKFNFEEY